MRAVKWIMAAVISVICTVFCSFTVCAEYRGCTEIIKNPIVVSSGSTSHKISFSLNGGSWAEGYTVPEEREYETELILPTAENLVKERSTFLGWYAEPDFSGEVQTVCPASQKEDITYYAKWMGCAYLLDGMDFNAEVKSLAAQESISYNTYDYLVLDIQWSDSVPDGSTTAVVTKETSEHRVLAYFDDATGIIYLVNEDNVDVYLDEDSSYMFNKFGSMTNVDMSRFKFDDVRNMQYMFQYCKGLSDFVLRDLKTSEVVNFKGLFSGSENMTSLDVSGWDTKKVTNMSSMFIDCKALKSIDFTGWNTCSVLEFRSTFSNCYCLKSLDICNWDTSSLTDTYYMFSSCTALKELDLSGWDTSKVTTMQRMFDDCNNLQVLNVSNWDTSAVTNMANMFQNCYLLVEMRMDNCTMGAVKSKGGMMYRTAYASRDCTIYCPEATETTLLSGTSITSSYFTFVHPEETAVLALSALEESNEEVSTSSNAINASASNAAAVGDAATVSSIATASSSNAGLASDFGNQ